MEPYYRNINSSRSRAKSMSTAISFKNNNNNKVLSNKVSTTSSPKQVAMNKFPAANTSNKAENKDKTNDDASMAHLEDEFFLPPQIQRNTLASTYILTRAGQQTDVSNVHTFTYRTSPSRSPSRSTREISPTNSRGDMSKQTTDTPICSNLTPKNLESSVSFTDSPERPPERKRYRFVKSRSLLRRLSSVLHRKNRGYDDRALLDEDLDLDEEIPIQDVFAEFNEEKEETEEDLQPPVPPPPPVSRPSTPATVEEVDDSGSDTTPIPASPEYRIPVFSSKLGTTPARSSTLVDSVSSANSIVHSTGSMSSISGEWGVCRRCNHGCNGNNAECKYERDRKRSYRYKADGSASTKSADLDVLCSCVDTAMETLYEGLAVCSQSLNSSSKSKMEPVE